jgi:hypothetical protein
MPSFEPKALESSPHDPRREDASDWDKGVASISRTIFAGESWQIAKAKVGPIANGGEALESPYGV